MNANVDMVKRRKDQFLHEFKGRAEKIYWWIGCERETGESKIGL